MSIDVDRTASSNEYETIPLQLVLDKKPIFSESKQTFNIQGAILKNKKISKKSNNMTRIRKDKRYEKN